LTIAADDGPVRILAFADDGRLLASRNAGKATRLWDAKTGRAHVGLAVVPASVGPFALTPTGTAVAVASFDGSVRVWDITARVLRTTLRANDGPLSALTFSPDGRTLACASFETGRLWTLRDGDR
jgi:WD40 repeat protein